MAESYWRKIAAPIIAEVLRITEGQNEKEIKKALREAYPFGQRKYHPHKIWLDEIKRQRGLKPPLGIKKKHDNQSQQTLFDNQKEID